MAETADHSLPALRARYGERYRWLLLLSVMVGTMASIMSSTIINVAIPDMSQHFTLGQERAQWATSGFMAAMTVSMLTTPWLLARYGYRSTYAGCMWLLLVGGVAGGFANSFPLVLAARVAEGLAAGVVQPIPAIIILRAFEPHEQGRASGIFGMGVVLAPALGPSIGGLLVDGFGWLPLGLRPCGGGPVVSPGRQRLPHFGRHDAGSAKGAVTGNAYSHLLILRVCPGLRNPLTTPRSRGTSSPALPLGLRPCGGGPVVSPGRQRLPHFGRHDAGSAKGAVTRDANAHGDLRRRVMMEAIPAPAKPGRVDRPSPWMPMFPLLSLVDLLIDALIFMIFVYSILSWFRLDPRNPLIRLVNGIVEPLLHPIRAIMPALGPVDLSPMIAMLVLWLLRSLLRGAA